MVQSGFDQLLSEALAQGFSGWDFSWLRGRWFEAEPSWKYRQIVQSKLAHVSSLLDMGTGGGEFLSSLSDLPTVTYATEGYPLNVPIARARLEPLGVRVVSFEDDRMLPLPDETFELVINRHESYSIPEVHRILKPRCIFLTQQVGPANCIQLNEFFYAPADAGFGRWTLQDEVQQLEHLGFRILRREEEFLDSVFHDVGAVVYYLKAIEWQIPDFEVDKYRDRLLAMHALIEKEGAFFARAHRFLIEAHKR
jgi:SAM-dependent methyltransferase